MTTDFSEVAIASSPFLYGSPVDNTPQDPPAPYYFRRFPLPNDDPEKDIAVGFELEISHLGGGFMQRGDFARGANQYDGDFRNVASTELNATLRRFLILPQLVTASGGSATYASASLLAWANAFATLVITSGGKLYKEASGGGLTAITFAPGGSYFSALAPIIIGGATSAERLCAMEKGAAPRVLSDLVTGGPTVSGTMSANLSPAWGMAQSPINATTPGTGTNLFYANGGIWTTPITAAIGTAPTQTQSNIPNGGYVMGIDQPPNNLPLRFFCFVPDADQTDSIAQSNPGGGYTVTGKVRHYDLEGLDQQFVPFSLARIYGAALWNRNVVAWDDTRIKVWDGDKERDLHFLKGRFANQAAGYYVAGCFVQGGDLYGVACLAPTAGPGTTTPGTFTVEKYNPTFDAWQPVVVGMSIRTVFGAVGGRLPLSPQTNLGYLIGPINGLSNPNSSFYFFLAPEGINPAEIAGQSNSTQYALCKFDTTTRTTVTTRWAIPGLQGRDKKFDTVTFMGQVPTNTTVGVGLNGGTALTFGPGFDNVQQVQDTGDDSINDMLQVTITETTTDSAVTPNALPILIRGRAYISGQVGAGAGLVSGPS